MSSLRIGILSSIIAAALVYVVLEWRPSQLAPAEDMPVTASSPEVSTLAPPPPDVTRVSAPPPEATPVEAPPGGLSTDEENNIQIYRRFSHSVVNVASMTYNYNFFLQPVPASGFGSGVVIDDEGHIVTNYHVIQDPRADLEVTLWDQSRHPAEVVGADSNNDLALVKVDAPGVEWVPLPMGITQGLQVGQKVLAIGNPFGLERTLTTGIISSLGRAIQAPSGRIIEGIIQTDAAINEGNSGGPLLSTRGELIGINTAIVSGSTGIGFAVPVETVRRVTGDLLNYGRVRRVTLGVDADSLAKLGRYVERLELGTDSGMLVLNVHRGGPADGAGLQGATQTVRVGNLIVPVGGDVIVSVDGRTVRTSQDIDAALEAHRPGDRINVTVVRDRQRLDVQVTLQEQPV